MQQEYNSAEYEFGNGLTIKLHGDPVKFDLVATAVINIENIATGANVER